MSALKVALLAIPVAATLAGCGGGSTATTSTVAPPASQASTSTPAQSATTATPAPTTSSPSPTASKTTPSDNPGPLQPSKTSQSHPEAPKPEEQLGKAPFLAAAGSAFGAFHEYVSRPQRKHTLAGKAAIAKAASAAAFASQQIAAAKAAAQGSSSLRGLSAPLATLQRQMDEVSTDLRAGRVSATAIIAARETIYTVSVKALEAGQPIQEVAPKIP